MVTDTDKQPVTVLIKGMCSRHLMLLVALVGVLFPPLVTASSPAQQWVDYCDSNQEFRRYAQLSDPEIVGRAFTLFEKQDKTLPMSKLTGLEMCLSVVATESAERPVFVLEKVNPETSIHQSIHDQQQVKGLVDRLSDLGIRLFSMKGGAGGKSLSAMMSMDEDLGFDTLHFGAMIGLQRLQRSFAVRGHNACMIALDTKPLSLFMDQRIKGYRTDNALESYIDRYGNATEFWHEVAHCNASVAATYIDGENASNAHSEQSECATNFSGSQIGASTPADNATSAQFTGALDTRALWAIREEAMADEFSVHRVSEHLGAPGKACRSNKEVSHPWQRYRVLDSVYNPSLDYMTWLHPWISDQSNVVKRQMLSDAFKGMYLAAKATLPRYRYEEMIQVNSISAGAQVFRMPGVEPDTVRAEAWSQWLKEQIKAPVTLQSNLGK
jgi:hypothetical protein